MLKFLIKNNFIVYKFIYQLFLSEVPLAMKFSETRFYIVCKNTYEL